LGTLYRDGYLRFNLADELALPHLDNHYEKLKAAFADLPIDSYGVGLHRYRRYTAAILLPWERSLHWLPKSKGPDGELNLSYYQAAYNPEHPDTVRSFPALSADTEQNPLLQEMVLFDFSLTRWPPELESAPFYVGVHLVKLLAALPGQTAMTSPNCLHQDGEPFHFAHLMFRENAVGGGNVVAAVSCAGEQPDEIAPDKIITRFQLDRPLEGYGIRDDLVSHHLDPIAKGTGPGPGVRAAILIDITPMRKDV
jgi:hypothetical protein